MVEEKHLTDDVSGPAADEAMAGRPAVFLDRDGVIIENRDDYVKAWDEVRFLPGALPALRRLGTAPHAVVIVTNQSAVGRGIVSLEDVAEINRRLIAEIEAQGGRVDACYLCPHRPDDACGCRKPAPGMLVQARDQLGLSLDRSYLVGDAATDIQAARAAGVRGLLVLTGRGPAAVGQLELETEGAVGCPVLSDLPAALDHILGAERTR
jgi:D-glycero-D-manno-heptose 1,7-bisphosphate phosphatase